jgi:hypothetical protein
VWLCRRAEEAAAAAEIARIEDEATAVNHKFSSLAEEAAEKTKKLTKLWKRYQVRDHLHAPQPASAASPSPVQPACRGLQGNQWQKRLWIRPTADVQGGAQWAARVVSLCSME